MHGHLAFWGAAMIVLAIIAYAMPQMTGRKRYSSMTGIIAFWMSNIGMLGMTGAFAVAGIAQVYLERKSGMEFLAVQRRLSPHFLWIDPWPTLFTIAIILYIYEFIRYGRPTDEALERSFLIPTRPVAFITKNRSRTEVFRHCFRGKAAAATERAYRNG